MPSTLRILQACALFHCSALTACIDSSVNEAIEDVPWSEAGEHLAQALDGSWRVMNTQTSDCPAEFTVQPMLGAIRFIADGHRVSLTPRGGTYDATTTYYAVDAQTLRRDYSLQFQDCVVRETATIHVEHLSPTFAHGAYQARYERNRGEACELIMQGQALPEQCTTTVSWQAVRE